MLSCQQSQNVIDGKKRIILNPTAQQKTDLETATFAENEVYGMDILISTGEDGKARPIPSILLPWPRLTLVACAGADRGVADDGVPAGPERDLPAQDEDVPCGVLGRAKEVGRVPVQHPRARGREACTARSPGGRPAQSREAVRSDVSTASFEPLLLEASPSELN